MNPVNLVNPVNLACALLVFNASVASAQATRAPVEAGVGFGGLATVPYEDLFGDGVDQPSVDVRMTVPFSPRFSLEGIVTIGRSRTGFFRRTGGLYFIQVKQRLESATRGRLHGFLTYGAAGYWAHVSQDEVRFIDNAGREIVSPAFSYNEFDEPIAAAVGGGVQYAFARRAALRVEAQYVSFVYIPIGARFSAGVSIPLGGAY